MTTEPLSLKNTKGELLEAYQELLQEVKSIKASSRREEQMAKQQKALVCDATQQQPDSVIKGLADLKIAVSKSLDDIGEKLTSEHKKLVTLQEAIQIEERNLENRHQIVVETDTLEALLLGQKERASQFESFMQEQESLFEGDMQAKRAQWKKEQEQVELQHKETLQELKKTRQREEEEYQYNVTLRRQKDQDHYETQKISLERELNEKKIAFEKEFSAREAALHAAEAELNTLREETKKFPETLKIQLGETEKRVTEKLTRQYQFERDLASKEVSGELKLLQQTIQSLEGKLKEREALIEQLTQKSAQATQQVQDIAIKAIEGASNLRSTIIKPERLYDEKTGKEWVRE